MFCSLFCAARCRIIASFVMLAVLFAAPAHAQDRPDADRPQNVILVIPDGYGPASATMARDYLRYREGITSLAHDSVLVGSVRTFASDSRITDSAAGATAYAAHTKTYNGAIAVDTAGHPVATLLEAAERRGMATGIVATSRITHATPAAFSAHVVERSMEDEIAAQQIRKGIEVILGGGRRHFLPPSEGGQRGDERNLVAEAQANGYQYVADRNQLDQVTASPVLGLFSSSHMSYEIDRDPAAQPSFAEMTAKAIELLQDNDAGYFLMVEASRIDHAGHNNDAAAHLHDILAYDEAMKTVLDAARRQGNTLVVSVSDHETGGMSLGRDGVYAWDPAVLGRVQASHGTILRQARTPVNVDGDTIQTIRPNVIREWTGIDALTDDEIAQFRTQVDDPGALNFTLAEVVSRRARVGWTTGGHTAIDVNLYAYGPGADRFAGNHDNTYVGATLADLLGFDLPSLTPIIQEQVDPTPSTTAAGANQ
jgi:alkaline phosphatase